MNNRIKQTAQTIADNISAASSKDCVDEKAAAETFVAMLQFAELNPLLEITAHGLRADFDDDNHLLIMVDPKYATVQELSLGSHNGPVHYATNKIYVAGRQSEDVEERKEMTRGSTLYGISQYVAEQVFQNAGLPYTKESVDNKARFQAICGRLYLDKDRLGDNRLTKELSSSLLDWQAQLIAKVTQFIWLDKTTYHVHKQFPELMEYYQEVFLPACKVHLQKLEFRQRDRYLRTSGDDSPKATVERPASPLARQTVFSVKQSNTNVSGGSPSNLPKP